jgi:ketosteroid isomerase-like protein
MSEQNKQLALKYIHAMDKGDAATMATCLAADMTIDVPNASKFGGPKPRETVIGSTDIFKRLMPNGINFTIHSITAEGDRVLAELESNTTLSNGQPYHNRYVMAFTFADGKIKHVNEYLCSKTVDEVLYPALAPLMAEMGLPGIQ